VRWEEQSVEKIAQARLPGYADSVTRTFDAPEALDIRFHEIHTKSALNRVPGASRVPFDWTINPYRGCTHACVYCCHGDTPILMADGTHRPLARLAVGDEIFGTERRGTYRHLVRTEVRAHWSTIKPAYRVTLADGAEIVASGDHRFLGRRGWKHVTGAQQGAGRRPHLTIGTELLGLGRFARGPDIAGRIISSGSRWPTPKRSSARSNFSLPRGSRPGRSSSRRGAQSGKRSARSGRNGALASRASATSSAGRCRRMTRGGKASWPGSSTRRARATGRRCACPTPTRRSSPGPSPASGTSASTW
jgi:hypothetical protein